MQGPIRWWARDHRAHHQFTDSTEDPYNIKQGFFHAHILWMILKQPKRSRRVDISDLMNDSVVTWQERYYIPLALTMGWFFPMVVAGLLWNDWIGGFIYGGILRMFVCHQGVFCINSICHWVGEQPYNNRTSPRNLPHILAVFTLGEGYHNFHHTFPADYRLGVKWYDFDFTKWNIWLWAQVGLARDLKCFKQAEIDKIGHRNMLRTCEVVDKSW
jgi:stearoyl-CoA desaturase (delta-9 desaturase)